LVASLMTAPPFKFCTRLRESVTVDVCFEAGSACDQLFFEDPLSDQQIIKKCISEASLQGRAAPCTHVILVARASAATAHCRTTFAAGIGFSAIALRRRGAQSGRIRTFHELYNFVRFGGCAFALSGRRWIGLSSSPTGCLVACNDRRDGSRAGLRMAWDTNARARFHSAQWAFEGAPAPRPKYRYFLTTCGTFLRKLVRADAEPRARSVRFAFVALRGSHRRPRAPASDQRHARR
jgi:hypothetical protein